jgi:hypothetical protein
VKKAAQANTKLFTMTKLIYMPLIRDLVAKQYPARPDILTALANCRDGEWTSEGYYEFRDTATADNEESKRGLAETVILVQEKKQEIILDLFKGGGIAGIEFLDLL